jgi:hypothetical protein
MLRSRSQHLPAAASGEGGRVVTPPLSRREEIEAAIAAYNSADHETLLSSSVAQLLLAMFPQGNVCQRSLPELAAEGFGRRAVPHLLWALVDAGFVSKEQGPGRTIYRLHLPPRGRR